MTTAANVDAVKLLLEAVSQREGARVLDIGCGAGLLARRLIEAGGTVIGVDPDDTILSTARKATQTASFRRASAEALPFEDQSFDFAILLNSLHHVPVTAMDEALKEALRVIRGDGRVFVIEPCAEGPLFEVLKIIDDETIVRRQAQDALERCVASGAARFERRMRYERLDRFADVGQFVDRIAAVEPARRQAAEAQKERLMRLFGEWSAPSEDGGRSLVQPMVASVLARAQAEAAP